MASPKTVLAVAAVAEAATGVALLLVPSWVGQWLLGAELVGMSAVMARVAGIALTAFAIACWPGTPRVGMLLYSGVVALYLGYLGIVGAASGVLLWPAVVLHVVLTVQLMFLK